MKKKVKETAPHCLIYCVSQEKFKVCICKNIQNLHNLPLFNYPGKVPTSEACLQHKHDLLGMGVVRTFWLEKQCFSYLLSKATWWEAGQAPQSLPSVSSSAQFRVSFLNLPHASGEASLNTYHICQPQVA